MWEEVKQAGLAPPQGAGGLFRKPPKPVGFPPQGAQLTTAIRPKGLCSGPIPGEDGTCFG